MLSIFVLLLQQFLKLAKCTICQCIWVILSLSCFRCGP